MAVGDERGSRKAGGLTRSVRAFATVLRAATPGGTDSGTGRYDVVGHRRPPWPPRRPMVAAGVALAAVVAGLTAAVPPALADTCSPNPIVCENAQTGSPDTEWDVEGVGDDTVQGFATNMSVNVGGTIGFKIRAEHAFTVAIYRLGYYNGSGARRILALGTFPAQNTTTNCITDASTEIYDCGTWAQTTSWTVPTTAVSGVYLAVLTRTDDTGAGSQIPFVVRNDSSTSKVLFKTSDATWQAYNTYGGADFYQGPINGRAYKISYNRPFATRGTVNGRDYLFSNEYPMIRFLERNGYDVSYFSDVDADRFGSLIQNHKVFLSVGHDEYWSYGERAAVEAARDAGTSLAFFSGNEVYWRTRWENSEDGHATDHRTLVSYKETWANDKIDPTTQWTGTYRDPRFSPPATGGASPENALTGTMFMSNSDDLAIQVPAALTKYRIWRSSPIFNSATTATLSPHTIGYESDEDLDNGFRPQGLVDLSSTTGATPEYLQDFGTNVAAGTTTHHITMYRASSGALVFGAGTIQWSWGLDENHDSFLATQQAADPNIQQATINILADMGAQPATIMSGRFQTSASTDTTGPTVTVSSPAAGASFANGAQVTVSGTASDVGGLVAGVEASTDGGTTWHPASGTTSWTYSYFATGAGSSTVEIRAVDDSANIGTAVSRSVTLTGPTSLFGNRVPKTPAANDPDSLELGVKVVPQTDGYIQGVRFYKGTGNTGSHTGRLWDSAGNLLASGTFQSESSTGWQTLTFPSPVAVSAGTTYVASYTAPNGHYAADPWFAAYSAWTAPPLAAPRNFEADGNGVYGNPGSFPGSSYQNTNYYVDVLFTPSASTPPQVTSVTPAAGAQYVPVTTAPRAVFNKAVDGSTLQFTLKTGGAPVTGAASYDSATKTATFTPSANLAAGTSYTASVQVSDTNGNAMAAPQTWTFSTDPGNTTIDTLFAANATPAATAVHDPSSVSLGVKFVPGSAGSVIGVRFYKGPGNTGTHTGSLWASDGTRLATATFADETASGWQTVYFSSAVPVTAGTTYIASYYAPGGNYAADGGYFATALTNGPLSAPSGGNGVFVYGSDAFPNDSYQSTNYWVDPLFVVAPAPSPSPSPSAAPSPTATQPAVPAGAVTVFPSSATPANASWNDPAAVTVGMKFTSDVAGTVNGVRFYKGSQNTGTHTATLWSGTGVQLATGTFVGETGSGWQTMLFNSPVTISANTTYLVSYSTTVGFYAVDVGGLSSTVDNAPLHVPANGGAYVYPSGFPTNAASHNYWVDVVFTPSG
jgi:hypothetical protein